MNAKTSKYAPVLAFALAGCGMGGAKIASPADEVLPVAIKSFQADYNPKQDKEPQKEGEKAKPVEEPKYLGQGKDFWLQMNKDNTVSVQSLQGKGGMLPRSHGFIFSSDTTPVEAHCYSNSTLSFVGVSNTFTVAGSKLNADASKEEKPYVSLTLPGHTSPTVTTGINKCTIKSLP